ncbi:MAG: alkaline phosphatase family protein [Betaproteobacteria bacterium]
MTTGKPSQRTSLVTLLAVLSIAGCVSLATSPAQKPRLVVFVAIDGLPQRQVVDYRDQLAPDGFRRFLDRGAWFADAHYRHANTQTAPGHATMLTGAYPHRTGIIANEWRNPATGEPEYNTGDTAYTYIGHKTQKLDGTSPRNLRVETVGDVLRRADPRSKVIAISGKDRGAILPAGKSGVAYMYMAETGRFASTTFYLASHPAWVDAFDARKPADAYFGREWRPLLDDAAYVKSLADEQKWYAKGGKLPKKPGEGMVAPGPEFYRALLPSPFGDALTLDFARAAIAGESLGRDEAPDILSISLSSHDYINHAYSAESRLSHDHLLQLDRLLEAFFRDLDATIGRDNYVVVLTADHGFMPAPELSRSLVRDAGKQSGSETLARLNTGLAQKFGEGKWALAISAMAIVVDRGLLEQKKVDRAAFDDQARRLLLAEPGIQAVYTRSELESGARAGAPLFDAMRKTWDRERSGDLQFALKPWWMMSSNTSATTHGSPHPYDSNVPILLYGPRWIAAGRSDSAVEVTDIAPTLARLLGVAAPPASEGKLLPLRSPAN